MGLNQRRGCGQTQIENGGEGGQLGASWMPAGAGRHVECPMGEASGVLAGDTQRVALTAEEVLGDAHCLGNREGGGNRGESVSYKRCSGLSTSTENKWKPDTLTRVELPEHMQATGNTAVAENRTSLCVPRSCPVVGRVDASWQHEGYGSRRHHSFPCVAPRGSPGGLPGGILGQ